MRLPVLAVLTGAVFSIMLTAGCSRSDADPTPAAAPSDSRSSSPTSVPNTAPPARSQVWDSSNGPDPCRTLTTAEVSAAVGEPVGEPVGRIGEHPYCSFKFASGNEYLFVAEDSGPGALNDFNGETADRVTAQPVKGLGDQAFWNPHSDGAGLQVMSGPTHVEIKFGGDRTPSTAKQAAITLMRTVLTRRAPT